MVQKINGTTLAGQFLTGGLNFYKVRTTLNILPTGDLSDESQARLDKLVEAISLRAQPVILSGVTSASETNPSDLASGGMVYTLSFAIEHNMAWEVQGSANPTLAETLDGVAGFEYDGISAGNVSVALVESL